MSHVADLSLLRPVAIYLLLDEAGVPRWVGKTENIINRMKQHRYARPWVRSCPIVECADLRNWREREQDWIARGRRAGWPLENKDFGGGAGGWHQSPEAKARISASKRGKRNSPEAIARGVATRKADYKPTKETIEKQRASLKGHIVSDETRARISAANKMRYQDPGRRAAISLRMKACWAARASDYSDGSVTTRFKARNSCGRRFTLGNMIGTSTRFPHRSRRRGGV